jgi:hypothetical protein
MMVDPLSHQAAGLAERRLGMVDAVERRAALEGRHIVGAAATEFAVRCHYRTLAPTRDLHSIRTHMNLQLRIALNNGLM